MEMAVSSSKPADLGSKFLRAWLETWISTCVDFRRWERENLILKHPSPETVAEHGRIIKTLIWSARMLQAMIADADYPARQLKPEVDGLLRQLEESWEMIHNPISDQECDTLLQKHFPNERGTGNTS